MSEQQEHTEHREELIHHEKVKFSKKIVKSYNKNYKLLLAIPTILLILSLIYLGIFLSREGDFFKKDVSLTGGTSITIFSEDIDVNELKAHLSETFTDFSVRELSDFRTGQQKAVIIESPIQSSDLRPDLENFLGYELDENNSSIESTGSSLGEAFYNQLRLALILCFIFMAIIVFLIFRTPIPSLAVVISAFADIVMTLAVVNLLGMKMSAAGITAILMLIGYSVDTDIMLTTRLLKRKENINRKSWEAFKTGVTMTFTSIIALAVALFITQSFSEILQQIFTILLIGLGFDLLNTWITNVSILRWYLEKKGGPH